MQDDLVQKDYDLSIVVPVYNAEKHIEKLATTVFALRDSGVRCQMICVDDASQDRSVAILREIQSYYPDMIVITNQENRGAGIARNLGWEGVTGRYTLFFDADDMLHGEVIKQTIYNMDNAPATDVTLFSYRYERDESSSFTDMSYEDRRTMDILLNGSSSATGRIEKMSRLLIFTNYPWNKILRTSRYKEVGMRFGHTKVNNDILGHWHSLLLAREITLCDAVVCTHIVLANGENLTNAFGPERLAMFDALEETYDFLEDRPALRRRFSHHFWGLSDRLVRWARPRIDPSLRVEFESRYADLLGRVALTDLARMRTSYSPALADSLVNQLVR